MDLDMYTLIGELRRGRLDSVQEILSNVPDVNFQVDGTTLLFLATFKQHQDIAAYLISKGADPNMRNEDGWETPDFGPKKK